LYQNVYGEDHQAIAYSLNELGILYDNQGRYSEAEPLYRQALEMTKRLLGEEHPHVAQSLNNLALLYRSQGRYSEAEPLYLQALEMRKRLLGEEHPDIATSLNDLALLYDNQGRFSEALPLYRQASEMYKRLLGEEHPWVATSLNNLAVLYANLNDIDNTLTFLQQGLNVEEYNLAYNLASGFERQKRDYLQTMFWSTQFAPSFHLHHAANNPEAANLALTTIFRRKGRILDVSTNSLQRLRQNLTPENQTFTYLTSGRDLLRLQNPSPSHDNPVLIADPYFQRPGEFGADIRFIDLAKKTFAPLPGTAEEAEAFGQLLNITPLMGTQATERAVKQVDSPSILHIATHGFFESNPQSEAGADTINNNPLLLSGLILAGFRVGDSGGEDGILTAQEVSALDLVGTKLVVLSACD
ncbi:MAG: CHAT domain-containing tetratricopeptide repeat protein, partial [Coleofasciculus sp. C2-GNP5-27]